MRDDVYRDDVYRDGVAYDGPQQKPVPYAWLSTALNRLSRTGAWATAISPDCDVIPLQAYPLNLATPDPQSIMSSLEVVTQGEASKLITTTQWPSPAADTTIDLSAVARTFGVHVRISNSVLNFKFGTYQIQLLNNATVLGEVYVIPAKLPVDIIILSIQSNGGRASIIGNTSTKVRFQSANNTSLVAASDMLTAETLNLRDIANLTVRGGAIVPK